MKIIRNSAKCNACGDEIESVHRHDFNAHYCSVKPQQAYKWLGDVCVIEPFSVMWNFAVDGGHEYLRRVGDGYTDTSEVIK